MDGHIEPLGDGVSITISGPSVALVARPAVWRVQACDSLGRPVAGFAILAQIGHGSGRPYREVTDANGDVAFEFTFSAPAASLQLQFAPAPRGFSASDRFPDSDRHSVTCAVLTADPVTPSPERLHLLSAPHAAAPD